MKIIVIVGPTAVGKTKLSLALAKKLDGEIINADAMQVYRGLDIGTAKISKSEQENIPHHLFDICDVNDNYTIFNYQNDARKAIKEIKDKNKVPIFVGGSGIYLKAALYNYELNKEEINNNYDSLTNEELVKEISKYHECDIHLNNRKRLVRELNKIENNSVHHHLGNEPLYDLIIIGLTTNRELLYQKINERVDEMFNHGLIDEVRGLYNQKINSKAINTGIGYKELYQYFNKEISLDDAIDLIKKNSRHLAKRQYTFFNHQMNVKWFNTNYENFQETINEVYQYIKENLS